MRQRIEATGDKHIFSNQVRRLESELVGLSRVYHGSAASFLVSMLPRLVKIRSPAQRQGRLLVDLAVRLDVLAVCAAFMFVGAVLLGAF